MSEYQTETAFLARMIRCADTAERHELEGRIARVRRDMYCVQRVIWLMGLFAALAAAGLAYGSILVENFPDLHQLVVKAICVVGLTSVTCLVTFLCLLAFYRNRLNALRAKCREIVTQFLEFPDKPPIPALRGSPVGATDHKETVNM